jgi:protein arginine kinase
MTGEQRHQVEKAVRKAVEHGSAAIAKSLHYRSMDDVSQTEAVSLVERHLVSPDFISKSYGRALLLSNDESISIMVNEEDHLRMQVMMEGMDPEKAYQIASVLDDSLNSSLHFAFHQELGYLTQCPTNLGTGMRASLMLHLPALQESGTMSRIAGNLSKLGLTLRGTYGEGSNLVGSLYQLSNQVSLGLSEAEAIANLSAIAMQLVEQERKTRKQLAQDVDKQDQVFRSVAILKSARVLSSDEMMKLMSNVRLGIAAGLIPDISYDTVNALMIQTQPATMSLAYGHGEDLSAQARDALRAKIVASALK